MAHPAASSLEAKRALGLLACKPVKLGKVERLLATSNENNPVVFALKVFEIS